MGIARGFILILFLILSANLLANDTIQVDNQFYIKHIVGNNDNFSKISKKYRVSIKDIIEHNDINSDLYYKQILYIPLDSGDVIRDFQFKRLKLDSSKINIAIILPFYVSRNDTLSKSFDNEEDANNFIYERSKVSLSFFQGAQLALDSISSLGKKIKVFVYDSENDSAAVEELINSNDLALMDIIIGPLYSSNIKLVAKKLKNNNNLKIISPFSRNTNQISGHNNVYQINTPFKNQSELLVEQLKKFKDEKIVIVSEEKDRSYSSYISNQLKKNNILHYRNELIFTHVDSIRQTFDSNQVVVIPSFDKVFGSKVLGSLGSIDSAFTIYGLSNWKDFDNLDINNLMKLNVHFFDPFYFNKGSSFFLDFQKKYEKEYNMTVDKYSALSYKIIFHFLTDFNQFNFERYRFNHGFVNTNCQLVKYQDYELAPVVMTTE